MRVSIAGALLLLMASIPLSAEEKTYICIDTSTGEVNPSPTPCSARGGEGYVPERPPSVDPALVSERTSPATRRTPTLSAPATPLSNPATPTTPRQLQSPGPPSVVTGCDAAGCWDTRGNRYTKGAGANYQRQDGRSCQSIGGTLRCN